MKRQVKCLIDLLLSWCKFARLSEWVLLLLKMMAYAMELTLVTIITHVMAMTRAMVCQGEVESV